MTTLFNQLTNRAGGSSAAGRSARLTLAIFGKHPGWNDHLPGLGVETEALVRVKHALYDTGMRGCIDSGAWRKFEGDKRIEGFDHTFLWHQTGSTVVGTLHSSEDGLRRKEYPLVLCVEGEGLTAETVLARAQPELQRLRDACQTTKSAEAITHECRAAQERLRATLAEGLPPPVGSGSADARRRFLDHPNLGPERVGLLRALHELGISGDPSARPDQRSRHARVPLAGESRPQSLLLWAELLRCAIPLPTPLMLVARGGVEWLDVIVGEPTSDDLVCLQSSPKAQSLATQTPYDLSPKLTACGKELEAKFLQLAASPSVTTNASTTGAPPPTFTAGTADASPGKPNRVGLAVVAVVVVVVLAAVLWWMSGTGEATPKLQPSGAGTSSVPAEVSPVKSPTVATPDLPDEAKLQAEAENKRLVEERRLAEERQRQEAQLQQQAEAERQRLAAQTNAVVPPSATPSAEETQTQARAKEMAAGLGQIALAQGNYARVIELSQKWPGDGAFSNLLDRLTTETNLLAQAEGWLRTGNYAALQTNRLPENSTFKDIQTRADTEKRLLDQTQAEFDRGDYTFLERQEVRGLQAREPFQKLLQTGTAEAKQLKAAQALQAENKPREALALLEQPRLEKLPFVPIRNWARDELAKREEQQRDSREAQNAFQKGQYAHALEVSAKYPGIPEFSELTARIATEQSALTNWQSRLASGDYTFLNYSGATYASKSPFALLANQGRHEQTELLRLSAFTNQPSGWTNLSSELDQLTSTLNSKPPFTDLRRWAREKADEYERARNASPAWLDDVFEPMLVEFDVKLPKDWLQSPKAKQAKKIEGFVGNDTRAYYLSEVKRLRREYEKRGWLDERNRRKYLDELEKAINRK